MHRNLLKPADSSVVAGSINISWGSLLSRRFRGSYFDGEFGLLLLLLLLAFWFVCFCTSDRSVGFSVLDWLDARRFLRILSQSQK